MSGNLMEKLLLQLKLLPQAEKEQWQNVYEKWGYFSLSLQQKNITLLTWQWDLQELANWFRENLSSICNDILEIRGQLPNPSESLAKTLFRFRQIDIEVAGDLGSDSVPIRAYEYEGGDYKMRNSNMIIGRRSSDGSIGWRDDFNGHDFGDGDSLEPHVNVWNDKEQFKTHLFYEKDT